MIDVGKIVAAHGIKGEVKVISLSSNPHRFKKGGKMELSVSGETVTINSCRSHKELLILGFEEIKDRNQAEDLCGSFLRIQESAVGKLKKDEYYFFQLENLPVITIDGVILGTMKDMTSQGANDVYRVDRGGGDYLLLPALKSVIKEVDLAAGKIIVALPPGLLEACQYHED